MLRIHRLNSRAISDRLPGRPKGLGKEIPVRGVLRRPG